MVLVGSLGATVTRAEVAAIHNAIVTFDSRISPRTLPRNGKAPVRIEIEGHIKTRKKQEPPTLTTLELAIHKAADVFRRGLPVCAASSIDPASTAQALAACPGAQIGFGRVRALSIFPGTRRRFYFNGQVVLFNGRLKNGRPAILFHVFNPTPPASFVFPFTISHHNGRFGTVLTAHVGLGHWSRITDFKLVVDRTYRYHGKRIGYLNAGCPAPRGFTIGISSFVQAKLSFADGSKSKLAVVSSCRVGP